MILYIVGGLLVIVAVMAAWILGVKLLLSVVWDVLCLVGVVISSPFV